MIKIVCVPAQLPHLHATAPCLGYHPLLAAQPGKEVGFPFLPPSAANHSRAAQGEFLSRHLIEVGQWGGEGTHSTRGALLTNFIALD